MSFFSSLRQFFGFSHETSEQTPTHTPQAPSKPTHVLVLYYSSYGHTETMAHAIAEGARSTGAKVAVKQVPEIVPDDIARENNFKTNQNAPIAQPDELVDYDAIIIGAPTRFGRQPAQMADFWDKTGALWAKGALIGKIGAVFTSTASQHGGQEITLYSLMSNLLHHGMVLTGLPYSFQGQLQLESVSGGTPYGASTIAGGDGSRTPSDVEQDGARFLGSHVALLAQK